MSPEDQRAKFGFLLDALAMGAPPHGGIALGIDRMTMVLAGEPNLRDVIAFPKNQAGLDPMSGAPSAITDAQLAELGLRVVVEPPKGPSADVPAAVAQRLLGLAAVAMLAGVIALAVIERRSSDASATPPPSGAVAPGGGWYSALAASRGPAGDAERTTCGLILTSKSLGVTHPVLPCGAKLLIRFGGQTVLTEVIDNRLKSAGHQFELTDQLAADLGIDGTQEIDWRFAARPAS